MRLKDKVAVVIGAGQTEGETIGNGRAAAIRFPQEGARVLNLAIILSKHNHVSQRLASFHRLDCLVNLF